MFFSFEPRVRTTRRSTLSDWQLLIAQDAASDLALRICGIRRFISRFHQSILSFSSVFLRYSESALLQSCPYDSALAVARIRPSQHLTSLHLNATS